MDGTTRDEGRDGGRSFVDRDLRGARFERCDLRGAVVRGSAVGGLEVDDPWLLEEQLGVVVNGVDVTAYVAAELDRRYPGRALRTAADPGGLRAAWTAVEDAWAARLDRVATMPAGTVDASVAGEWSFAQTLRHLVMATDVWLRQTVQGVPDALHPVGQPHAEYATDGYDLSVFSDAQPTYDEVLTVRAERQAMVRGHLASMDDDELARLCPHPWSTEHQVSVLQCLQTIVGEEWEHLRYADRDLDALAAGPSGSPTSAGVAS